MILRDIISELNKQELSQIREDKKIDHVLIKIENQIKKGRFLPIIGPEKGAFVYLITKLAKPKKILELGTLIGYSSLIFAKATQKKAKIITIDWDKKLGEEAKTNFQEAGVKNAKQLCGDATEIVKKLKGNFDLILLDVGKEYYTILLPHCIRLLRRGGILLIDNVLWDNKRMEEFRNELLNQKVLETIIVPIVDGVSLSQKL